MPVKKLGGDEPLPKPDAARERQGTTVGVAPPPAAPVVPPGSDPYALHPTHAPAASTTAVSVCPQCHRQLPSGAQFCGECGVAAVMAGVITMAPSGADVPVSASPSVASASAAAPAPLLPLLAAPSPAVRSDGAKTQKLPAATKRVYGKRTAMAIRNVLKNEQREGDIEELKNLGRALGVIAILALLALFIVFIVWAVRDGQSRRRPPPPVSDTPISISVPLLIDAGPTD